MADKAKKTKKEKKEDISPRRKLILERMKNVGIDPRSLRLGKDFDKEIQFTPTGQMEVDAILGDKMGIPDGTLVEFCGDPQSGKSYLSYKTIAEYNKKRRRAAVLNVENSLYPPRLRALGIDTNNEELFEVYDDIDTAEQYGEWLLDLVRTEEYGIIVVDSISALLPECEWEKSLSDNPKIGAHALFINRLTKKLLSLCSKTKTTVIFINQFRLGNGIMPNQMVKQATGGKGVEYFCHMRLWFTRVTGKAADVIGEGGEVIGGKTRVFLEKTRYGTPHLTAEFPIFYKDAKVDPIGEFLYLSTSRGKEYVTYSRKIYQYIDKDTNKVLAKSKDPITFMQQLMEAPAPSKKTKGDDSNTAFEYICGRLRYNQTVIDNIVAAVESGEIDDFEEPNQSKKITFDADKYDPDNPDNVMTEEEADEIFGSNEDNDEEEE